MYLTKSGAQDRPGLKNASNEDQSQKDDDDDGGGRTHTARVMGARRPDATKPPGQGGFVSRVRNSAVGRAGRLSDTPRVLNVPLV